MTKSYEYTLENYMKDSPSLNLSSNPTQSLIFLPGIAQSPHYVLDYFYNKEYHFAPNNFRIHVLNPPVREITSGYESPTTAWFDVDT